MSFAPQLRRLLVGFQPRLEHLYLLEPFQIGQVVARLGMERLAGLVVYDPTLRRVLELKDPSIAEPLEQTLDSTTVGDEPVDEVLWEIADLLVYAVDASLYDAIMPAPPGAVLRELIGLNNRERARDRAGEGQTGGVLADVGAGTGRLAFRMCRDFETVYAVEPVGRLRAFVRSQRDRMEVNHLHVVDGFLHDLPFPPQTLDALITRSAMGWRLAEELDEVDRVLRPGGRAVHLTGIAVRADAGSLHSALLDRGYTMTPYPEGRSECRAYTLTRP